MKLSNAATTLLLAVIVPSASARGFLQSVFTFFSENIAPLIISPPITEGCAAGLAALGLDGMNCACTGVVGIASGIDLTAACTSPDVCFPDDLIGCGKASVTANFAANLTTAAIGASVESCLTFDANLPPLLTSFDIFSNLCVVAESSDDGVVLDTCTIALNGNACTSCTVCDSGLGFSFDCSNVDLLGGLGNLLNNPLTVPGPSVDVCSTLGFLAE